MLGESVIRKTCKRYNTPWDAHELTFSCYGRKAFLGRDRTREDLVEAVNKARHRHPFHIWAYVIMPEHVHLLIWPTMESYDVSAILYAIKYPVARRVLDYLRKHNPAGLRHLATGQKHVPYRFWLDGGGFDRNVQADQAVWNMADYMHANPVRRELASRPEEWHWSSYKDWEESGTGPIPIDRESLEWALASAEARPTKTPSSDPQAYSRLGPLLSVAQDIPILNAVRAQPDWSLAPSSFAKDGNR